MRCSARMVPENRHCSRSLPAHKPQTAAISGFGFLAVMMSIRRGLIGRLPFLGPQVKAYRRAMLRKTIETAQKQLDKLTPQTAQS